MPSRSTARFAISCWRGESIRSGRRQLIVTLYLATSPRHRLQHRRRTSASARRGEHRRAWCGDHRRRDADDAAETPLAHPRHDVLEDLDRGPEVQVERELEVVVGDLVERARLGSPVVEHDDVGLRSMPPSSALRPSSVVMSAAIGVTTPPVAARISAAVRSSFAASRPLITTSTPSADSASAHARPSP